MRVAAPGIDITRRHRPAGRAGARPPGVAAALAARVLALRLDRDLAEGAIQWRSARHAARALQLTAPHSRATLARSLELLAERARQPGPDRGLSAAVAPSRAQVHDALPSILATAARLRSTAPVRARGIAVLRALLADGCGPCYARAAEPGALRAALDEAGRWLDTEE